MADLTKRQQDLLKVPPIVWDSVFGGYLFRIQTVSENIDHDPAAAKVKLEELAAELRNMRKFMIEGDQNA